MAVMFRLGFPIAIGWWSLSLNEDSLGLPAWWRRCDLNGSIAIANECGFGGLLRGVDWDDGAAGVTPKATWVIAPIPL